MRHNKGSLQGASTTANIDQDGKAGEAPGCLKQDRLVSFEAFVERYCSVACIPPKLRCHDCGAELDQAVRV